MPTCLSVVSVAPYCCVQVAAVGPLLSSLRTRGEVGRSLTLVPLCLDDHLFLDENTLKSLNICSDDVHGFVHAKRGREGFSILGAYSRFVPISRQA